MIAIAGLPYVTLRFVARHWASGLRVDDGDVVAVDGEADVAGDADATVN